MSPDDATDVAKALAAFGAPSIRYHSFGQGQVKPSSVVLPRLGLAPLETAADSVPTPLPAMPANPMLSMLPTTPRLAEPVSRPAATPPMAVSLTPPRLVTPPLAAAPLAASPLAVPPLAVPPLDMPMPPMPAFRRTLDPAALPRPILPYTVPSHAPSHLDPADEPSAAITMTLRALLETDQTMTEGLSFTAGQTQPAAFAAMRLPAKPLAAKPPSAPFPSAPFPSTPPISIQVNATPKLAVLPVQGRSAPAGQPGQSLAAIFAFLVSDPTLGENSSFL